MRSDRANKRSLIAHVEPEIYKDFKVLAAQEGMTTDMAMSKAIALLFTDFGRKPPAKLRQKLAGKGLD